MKKKSFTDEDRQELLRCEEIIRNDHRDDLQLGEALAIVFKKQLYLINHTDIKAWCSAVLKKSRQHAYRLINAKAEFDRLKQDGITLPSERKIRVLLKERDAALRTKIAEEAISAGRGKTTTNDLEEIRQSLQNNQSLTSEELVESVSSPVEFGLEKYLEEFIVANFETVFGGRLQIYQNPLTGEFGQQYQTATGAIDILALDTRTKSFVVIELKKGKSSDDVVGQIQRYMGWVKEHLCGRNQSVKGLIICKEPDSRLSYALKMTRGIEVKYYNVSFQLLNSFKK
jgi:hypothetical protein